MEKEIYRTTIKHLLFAQERDCDSLVETFIDEVKENISKLPDTWKEMLKIQLSEEIKKDICINKQKRCKKLWGGLISLPRSLICQRGATEDTSGLKPVQLRVQIPSLVPIWICSLAI